ncbi:prostatic acid phosphatase-like isoform X2 [Prorops nasuta]|uniref:prostatic acid phosphatase-like isoform X2 n=1 Tax=Prorops nasuta TaxID=863751 RepID=UPI0034CDC9CE
MKIKTSFNSKLYFFIIFVTTLNYLAATAADDSIGQIIFANVIYRHGDRTPLDPYPNDPYNNESLWSDPYGQLTNIGKHQHLLLGRWLRNRYSHLIPKRYSLYDIYIKSTDTDRTLMSAEANLAGLYPPIGEEIWDINNWLPIPVHTTAENEDHILAGRKYCARYDYELDKVLSSPEIKFINKKNKELYEYLTQKTGRKISTIKSAERIYDTLFIENVHNKTLPEWTKTVFPDKLYPLAAESFRINAYNKILQRLISGSLVGEMIDHMVKKSRNALRPDRKLWIYSAHDETLANLLMTLNIFDSHCPPYAATILIELRTNLKKQFFVTVSYKNSTDEPALLTIPGCNALCSLNDFIKLTRDIVPEDWERECSLDLDKLEYKINTSDIIDENIISIIYD